MQRSLAKASHGIAFRRLVVKFSSRIYDNNSVVCVHVTVSFALLSTRKEFLSFFFTKMGEI